MSLHGLSAIKSVPLSFSNFSFYCFINVQFDGATENKLLWTFGTSEDSGESEIQEMKELSHKDLNDEEPCSLGDPPP